MAKDNLVKIGGELVSVAPDGIVADALAIMDYTSGRNKTQKVINDEIIAGLSDRYTKAEVNALLETINQFSVQVVNSLPQPPSESTMGIIYLVPSARPETQNVKDEFITVRSGSVGSYTYAWEQIGSTAIDLSDYVTETELSAALATYVTLSALNTTLASYATKTEVTTGLSGKVDKVTGKQLSTEDYTSADKTKLSGLPSGPELTSQLGAKQDTIADLPAIRTGAAAGNTAVQPAALDDLARYEESGTIEPLTNPGDYATKGYVDAADEVLEGEVSQLEAKVDDFVQPLEVDADFAIEDENGKAIVIFSEGGIRTKNFDSKESPKIEDGQEVFEVTDENGNAILVIHNGDIASKNFNSRKISQRVSALEFSKFTDPIRYYAADNTKPQNIGQKNCISFATELCELRWRPIRPMPSSHYGFVSDGTEDTNVVAGRKYYRPYVEMVGIPYSNAGEYGRNIGSDVRIETFMTALKNPNSVVYTIDTRDTAPSSLTSCYYGNNCSSFTNLLQNIPVLCFGRNCFFGGNRILEFPKNVEGAQIGDIVYLQRTVKDSGHAIIIIGITKTDGIITSIKTSEEDSRSAVIVDYTKEAFINAFFKGGRGYEYGELFRNNGIINLESYEVFDAENYEYSETIGLNLGNNTNYDKVSAIPIEVTLLEDVSFSLIKDGTNYGTYSPSDGIAGYGDTKIVTIVNKALLDPGVYEVRPSSGLSQYFCLAKSGTVTAKKQTDGSILVSSFGHSSNVVPYGVLFFSNTEYETTRGMYEMGGNGTIQVPAGFFQMIDTYGDVAYVIVAYRNEYGTIYSEKVQISNN